MCSNWSKNISEWKQKREEGDKRGRELFIIKSPEAAAMAQSSINPFSNQSIKQTINETFLTHLLLVPGLTYCEVFFGAARVLTFVWYPQSGKVINLKFLESVLMLNDSIVLLVMTHRTNNYQITLFFKNFEFSCLWSTDSCILKLWNIDN